MAVEKSALGDISQVENLSDHSHDHGFDSEDIKGRDFTIASENLPPGYFKSFQFIGSICAVALTFACGQGGFSLVAPVIPQINADIGPDPNIAWLSISYLLTTSIGLLVVGRVTDIFGRRNWFIGASFLGVVGSVVCATAKSVPALLAGQTIIGLGASVQLSYAFAIGELVPIKHRFLASAFCFSCVIPWSGFGPAISYNFIFNTAVGWRGIFWMLLAGNVLATILFIFCYHPPNFEMKHDANRKWEFVKDFDYLGVVIFVAGLLLAMMGLSWGGSLHPWKSAYVISTMAIGGILLIIFFLYEAFVKLKEPLLPRSIFANRGWVVTGFLWGTGSALYYANAILWPSMVTVAFAPGHGYMRNGLLASIPGCGIILGEFTSAALKRYTNRQLQVLFPLVGVILGCMATSTPDSLVRSSILIFLASYFIGWCEMINSTVSSISINDQREIGTAVGAAGACRSFFATIGSTIFVAVLTNRLATTVPLKVVPALVAAGCPTSSLVLFITAVSTNPSGDLTSIAGVTPAVAKAGLRAYQEASMAAYSTVWLTTIAISAISIVAAFWAPNVNHLLTSDVNAPIHRRGEVVVRNKEEQVGEDGRGGEA